MTTDDYFLIDQEQIDTLKRLAGTLRDEARETEAAALEEIARCAQQNRVIDDTCY